MSSNWDNLSELSKNIVHFADIYIYIYICIFIILNIYIEESAHARLNIHTR